jgi:ribosomal protein L18E
MRVTVVYESIFGNTHRIATAIQRGAAQHAAVTLSSVSDRSIPLTDADVIVIGGPTHAFGMSTPATRGEAVSWTTKPERRVRLDAGAPALGVREWLEAHPVLPPRFATFDTRSASVRNLPGSAARRIDRRLRSRGLERVTPPMSFYVSSDNALLEGEEDRAYEWGAWVAALTDTLVAAE